MSVEDENERLREEVARLGARLRVAERLVGIAPVFFGHLSPRGEVLEINELALRVIGARAEDVMGTLFWEAPWWRSPPGSAARIRAALADAARGLSSRFDLEFWAHTPGDPAGETRWVAIEVAPVSEGDQPLEHIVVTGIDITERRNAQAALVFEHHKLHALFEESPGAMAIWRGDDLVFEMVNPAYQAFFPGRQLLGRPLLEACPELADQPFPHLMRKVLATGEPYVAHEELARIAAGEGGPLEDRYYDFTYLRVDDADGKPYGVYDHAIEVTDRVRSRMALEASRAELESTVRALEQERELRERFVAALTHDLRTPLTVAKLGAFALARDARDASKGASIAARIGRSVDRAEALIRDLLDVSAIRAGERVALSVAECDLRAITQAAVEELAAIHGARFVLDAAEPIAGRWDCSAVRRIVENLAANAVKYGAPDTPITITLARRGERVTIAIHNHGDPIPRDERELLFDPFRRADAALASAKEGWGIGLTLVKALADAHGGGVEVTSERGEGTTFSVWLPAETRAAARDATLHR